MTEIFTETVDLSESTMDTDSNVLRNVVLIRAGMSTNKRDYPAAVLQASLAAFEGVAAFADHPAPKQQGRSIREFTGVYKNVRFENNRVKADRYFSSNEAGRDVRALAEDVIAGRIPRNMVGLSINAHGTGRKRDDGSLVVESISLVHSVDDVVWPAAAGGYMESNTQETQPMNEPLPIEISERLIYGSELSEFGRTIVKTLDALLLEGIFIDDPAVKLYYSYCRPGPAVLWKRASLSPAAFFREFPHASRDLLEVVQAVALHMTQK